MGNLAMRKTSMIKTAAALGLALAPAGRGLAAGAGPFDGGRRRGSSGTRNERRACALTFTKA